ncbi:MAG: hypothetical protein EAZ89_00300, partial [Bacteroidetes bacterium]
MTEHIFLLDNISPLEVFGVNNLRLQQIAEGFPEIKFVARGDELKVKGDTEKIEKLKAILGTLFDEIRSKGRISDNRFNELIHSDKREQAPEILRQLPEDEVLVHGSGGIIVRPKTLGQKHIVASAMENDITFAVGPA